MRVRGGYRADQGVLIVGQRETGAIRAFARLLAHTNDSDIGRLGECNRLGDVAVALAVANRYARSSAIGYASQWRDVVRQIDLAGTAAG